METILKISGIGFLPFSARGCVQQLSPIQITKFARTIHGELIPLKQKSSMKYRSSIYCEDQQSIGLGQLTIGDTVRVECIQNLSNEISPGQTTIKLAKPYVEESVVVFDQNHQSYDFNLSDGVLSLGAAQECVLFVRFRPILKMLIQGIDMKVDEWGLKQSWKLDLEEV